MTSPPAADGLDISVLVCTRNRARKLHACLEAMRGLVFDAARWELVVVDNGSTDDTRAVVAQFAETVPFRVSYVAEGRKGVCYARNTGVVVARSPLIAYVDDDCYVEPGFLSALVAGFADGRYGYIGGRVMLHDPTDAPEAIREDLEREEMPPGTFVRPGFLHGANLAFRREAWADVGGFDVRLGGGTRFGAEDADLVGRMSAAGWRGAYLPEPGLRHHHGRKPGADLAPLRGGYRRGIAAYLWKSCLDRRIRSQASRYWYYRLRSRWQQGHYRDVFLEIVAAAEFLARSAVTSPQASPPPAST